MSQPNHNNFLDTALKAAQAGGKIIKDDFGEIEENISYKDAGDISSPTDEAAEHAILKVIKGNHPDHAIFAEESGAGGSQSEYTWVIDPLDGTTNFSRGIPFCCTSIALSYNGNTLVAVVYSPITDEIFVATADQPSTLNDKPIKPSQITDLSRATVSLNRNSNPDQKARFTNHIFVQVASQVRSYRILGSTALEICYTAAGRFDAFVDNQCKAYDCLAGNLIAKQCGLSVTNFSGQTWRADIDGSEDLLIANPELSGKLTSLLSSL